MTYRVTKTITHEQGWSCAFRQWRAESHCRYLHGYALSVAMTFEADELDDRRWVVDFGAFTQLRRDLADTFDHRTVIAADDPHLDTYRELDRDGVLALVVLPDVGCEAFAEYIAEQVQRWLWSSGNGGRVRLVSVEVREHGSNSATYLC